MERSRTEHCAARRTSRGALSTEHTLVLLHQHLLHLRHPPSCTSYPLSYTCYPPSCNFTSTCCTCCTCGPPSCTSLPAVFYCTILLPAVLHLLHLQHLRPADHRLLHLHFTRAQHRTAALAARRRPVQPRCAHASSSPSRARYASSSSTFLGRCCIPRWRSRRELHANVGALASLGGFNIYICYSRQEYRLNDPGLTPLGPRPKKASARTGRGV